MGGVCSSHGPSPLALGLLFWCMFSGALVNLAMGYLVTVDFWCFSLRFLSVFSVCQLHVISSARLFGWVGCSFGTLVFGTGNVLGLILGFIVLSLLSWL